MECFSLFTVVTSHVLECCGRLLCPWKCFPELFVAVFRPSAAIVVEFVLCSPGRQSVIRPPDCGDTALRPS
jgi:hypothetical protein